VFGKGRKVLVGLHADSIFQVNDYQRILSKFGSKDFEILKGSLNTRENQQIKAQYLNQVETLSRQGLPATLWYEGHSQETHFWFKGNENLQANTNLVDPDGISYQELAKALVKGQARKDVIDLSHILIGLDGCNQHEFALKVLRDEIFKVAIQEGKKVQSLPWIITSANKNRFNYLHVVNRVLEGIRLKRGEPLLLKHILEMDQRFNQSKPFYEDSFHTLEETAKLDLLTTAEFA